ncbi:MAG: T9SS type A sorting domain-containing protein [Saprospiraceae bacterium]|nr:T9SS type A sorting domain-containing protein [Saprospiraceae bacterium]MCF8252225.1 T9SS type A sorting domain-containing protein [Saprospiraceae bacterium]MCF8282023.1 T9SS type A sorting domain-containing protein [Bacteroidales bacterium]MCF8311681.1 T9SS type A sorting domain-containing protein [Saprospiraceae bacterium]MCF8442600.1 T9SS type A sorting domain-containing protein [Saprospiraceae bacterium]
MKHFILILPFLLPVFATAQKWDYQWPMGYSSGADVGIPDLTLLDFTGDTVAIYSHAFTDGLGFGSSGSFICDGDGQLVLTTNNCAVYDQDFQLVPGSESLTPGWGYNVHCGDQSYGGYIGDQLTVFLPQIGNDSIVYLIHKDNIIFDSLSILDVLSTKLYLSTFVRKADSSYYLKEKKQLLQGLYNHSVLTACLHADGDKWWANMIEYNTNRFNWFLIGGQDTVQGPFVQEFGNPILNYDINIGQVAFSPDASMLAYNLDQLKEIYLYSFNNATAEVSNLQVIPYPATEDDTALGVAFSFDSRFIYASSGVDLYQIDLQDGNSVEHVAHHISYDEDNWPVGIGFITLGPDCRMYLGPATSTYYLHVVHRPNEKGAACGFEARALRSPSNLVFNVPNLPMYRFGGACDSTIAFPYKDTTTASIEPQVEEGVRVFPNPCVDYFTVAFPSQAPRQASLLLFDALGRLVMERSLSAINNVFDVNGLEQGFYFYRIMDGEQWVQGGKLVKVE